MAKASQPNAPQAGAAVVSLKVTLQGSKPPIWRRILVPASIRLGDLSTVLQIAMGWHGGHLHSFTIAGRDYGPRGDVEGAADENRASLASAAGTAVKRFTYTYDFGDDWQHNVTIEKTEPAKPGQTTPICVAGKRNCPPEDCGGIWGYAELLEILADPGHPERAERLEWIDTDDFDPEDFDIDFINQRLTSYAARPAPPSGSKNVLF